MDATLRALVACVVFVPALAWSQPAPSWEQAKKDVLADYKKEQPGDKVLEITGPERKEGVAIAIRYYGGGMGERAHPSKTSDPLLGREPPLRSQRGPQTGKGSQPKT